MILWLAIAAALQEPPPRPLPPEFVEAIRDCLQAEECTSRHSFALGRSIVVQAAYGSVRSNPVFCTIDRSSAGHITGKAVESEFRRAGLSARFADATPTLRLYIAPLDNVAAQANRRYWVTVDLSQLPSTSQRRGDCSIEVTAVLLSRDNSGRAGATSNTFTDRMVSAVANSLYRASPPVLNVP